MEGVNGSVFNRCGVRDMSTICPLLYPRADYRNALEGSNPKARGKLKLIDSEPIMELHLHDLIATHSI